MNVPIRCGFIGVSYIRLSTEARLFFYFLCLFWFAAVKLHFFLLTLIKKGDKYSNYLHSLTI